MASHQSSKNTSNNCTGLGGGQTPKRSGPFGIDNVQALFDTDNNYNKDMSRFTYDKVIAHWEHLDKTVAKAYTETILKFLWSGTTVGGLSDEVGIWVHGPGMTFVIAIDLEAKKSADLWLIHLPQWRIRRIESEIIKLLQEYGWESTRIALTKGNGHEVLLEWNIRLPEDLIAQFRQ